MSSPKTWIFKFCGSSVEASKRSHVIIIVVQLGFFIIIVRLVHLIHILRSPRESVCSMEELHLLQKTVALERRGNIR